MADSLRARQLRDPQFQYFADGGVVRPRGEEGGGLSKEAVMAAIARQRRDEAAPTPAPRREGIAGLAADFLRNPRAILQDREKKAGLQEYADGGRVRGHSPRSDSDNIDAKLTAGEYVLPVDTVEAVGEENLDALRAATHDPRQGRTTLRDGMLHMAGGGAAKQVFGQMAEELQKRAPAPASPMSSMADDLLRNPRPAPPETHRLFNGDAYFYENSPDGRSSQRAAAAARAETAGVGSKYSGAPMGNNSIASAADEANAAARQHAQRTQWSRAGIGSAPATAAPATAAPATAAPATAAPPAGRAGVIAGAKNFVGGAARTAGGVVAVAPALVGGVDSLRDMSTGYRDHFAASIGQENAGPLASVGTDTLRTLANVGNAFTGGYAERLGRGISNYVSGGSFGEGWNENDGRTQREQFEFTRDGQLSAAQPAAAQPAAAQPAAAQPAAGQPAAGQPAAGQPPAAQPTDPSTPTNAVTRSGNRYAGGNVAGDITINGQAPRNGGAISAQNMAAADALAGREQLRALGGAAPPQPVQFAQAPTVLHSGNDWASRNALRNMEVSASSITNDGGRWDQHKGVSSARKAYEAALGEDIKRQGAQPLVDLETNKSNNSLRGDLSRADAARYAADQNLRGDVYKTAGAERTAARAAAAAAGKQASDDVIRQNDLDIRNADRTRDQFAIYGEDGKVDGAATQRAVSAVDKVIPGYSTMSESARKKHTGTAEALHSIYGRSREGRELGLGQAVFGNANPQLDSMPEFKGGKLKRQGLTGMLPGQAGRNGYYVEMPDGREINLGQGLAENELNLIRRNTASGKWGG